MNTLFPGRPDYVGPTVGWFGLLHHDRLYEESHNIMKRVEYVRAQKPRHEISIRLHNMIYLGGIGVSAKLDPLYSDLKANLAMIYLEGIGVSSKTAQLYADYKAQLAQLDAEILAYIKTHISDCAWNGTQLEMEK